ncbi:MAG: hypothetical protein H8D56_00685 [Planctomycetes bacterium]|nr:hypothetical protein [Planctomycetota bacterium]MBL7146633.1 hypothetical protein [Phycisphaerae bacterium]
MNINDLISRLDYYFIEGGIYFFSDVFMTLDNRYFLFHKAHPPSPLFIFPIEGERPNFNDLVFYNDCLAYLHDVPFIFYSSTNSKGSPFKPIIQSPGYSKAYATTAQYHSNIHEIFSLITNFKINGYIPFLWEKAYERKININLRSKYLRAFKEIRLYSMALKQLDPFVEFLCYYRIIESVAGNNGKEWIRDNLNNTLQFNFGFLEVYDTSFPANLAQTDNKRRLNLFSVYKRRARSRINNLNKDLNGVSIQKYLYNTIRCGIAHGKDEVVTYDYSANLEDVAKDLFVIKLLARYAIESTIVQ